MKLTLGEALKKGVEAHKNGQLQEAERLYSTIINVQPNHADANHNMGVLAVGLGKIQASLPFFKVATIANPKVVQFWLSYINALMQLGRSADAQLESFKAQQQGFTGGALDQLEKNLTKQGLEINNTHAVALESSVLPKPNILDNMKVDQALRAAKRASKSNNIEEAKTIYQDILYTFPQNKQALKALQLLTGVVLVAQQDPSSEEQQSIISLYTQGKFKQALADASKMLDRFPNSSLLYNITGASNAALDQFEAAVISYKKALKITADSPETYYNMAAALNDGGNVEAAIESYRNALKLKPDHADAYRNLGSLFQENHRYKEARDCFDELTDKYSVAKALESTYFLEHYEDFNGRIKSIAKKNSSNIRVAAMSSFASHQFKQKDAYPFCKNPNEFITFSNIKNHIPDSERFIETLLDEVNERNTAWEPRGHATVSGFHTSGNLFSKPSKTLRTLESVIKKELQSFYLKFQSHNNGLIQEWPAENHIKAWYVRMLKNGHQKSHIHSSGWVSGVFYLKTVESPQEHEGAIEFGLHGYDYPIKNEDYPRQIYQPCNGDIVLFPSSLFHQTIPVLKDVERCVIAFDFKRR